MKVFAAGFTDNFQHCDIRDAELCRVVEEGVSRVERVEHSRHGDLSAWPREFQGYKVAVKAQTNLVEAGEIPEVVKRSGKVILNPEARNA